MPLAAPPTTYTSSGRGFSTQDRDTFYPARTRAGRGPFNRGARSQVGTNFNSTSQAPWCFTKVMHSVVENLRSRGVRMIFYLNDILLMAQDVQSVMQHFKWATQLLQELGFLINVPKSELTPARQMEFLGFQIDSVSSLLSLPVQKLRSIKKEIRALQCLKIHHLQRGVNYLELIDLTPETRNELQWWLDHMAACNGRAIFGSHPDVSKWGLGARCGAISTGGRWSRDERNLHMNCLELLAGSFAIRTLAPRSSCCVLLRMDNISAVHYINKLGGTRSLALLQIARTFWQYCLQNRISVMAEYLSGQLNVVADWNSRYLQEPSEWKLQPAIFQALETRWGQCHVDLFASRLSYQIDRFFSWRPDPLAIASDAFLQNWTGSLLYAFPPFLMLRG
ncbi:hypothetical protein NDU88_005766 [Pleurodeles waltl]|uniref:ribonuclease H n=1 Tax=Pleurodeles waltl TaxID=8319 RepID=A0AAV7LM24_PLEWA|nr:hypothetical protein NDU88_005766 [Pleurodeles waltl]